MNKLQIAFTIPDQVPGTYATVGTLPSECKFDEAYVIFYDALGKYVAYTSSNVSLGSSTGSFEVKKPSEVELDKPYKLLLLANMKYYLDDGYGGTDEYIEANKRLNYNAGARRSKIYDSAQGLLFAAIGLYPDRQRCWS